MIFPTELWLAELLVYFLLLLLSLYYVLTSNYNYWKTRNVPYATPVPGFGSNFLVSLNIKSQADMFFDIYNRFKKERFCGFFQFKQPSLMVIDPDLIERILIKDFSPYFEGRGPPLDIIFEPLTLNLVSLQGNRWRTLRHKLSPTFTSGKLKRMFHTMCQSGDYLFLEVQKYSDTNQEVNAKDLMSLFTTDIIASCAFGLQLKLDSPEGKKFKRMAELTLGKTSNLKLGLALFAPKLVKYFGIKMLPSEAVEYFVGITKATIEHRLKNNIQREDMFQMLLDLKKQDSDGEQTEKEIPSNLVDKDDFHLQYEVKPSTDEDTLKFTEMLLANQTFVFLVAGAESVADTLSILLHFLSVLPEVQSKLQAEVDSVLASHGGQLSYEALKEMNYLDQIIQESQRMFPVSTFVSRVCTSPYKVPGSDLVIEKGTGVVIPTLALQNDPRYYPDPEKFDPDRFAGNNFKPSAIYNPFGDGPRICIALRFAILEIKVCLAKIMSKYSVKPTSRTQTPLRSDPGSFANRPKGGIWITIHGRIP